MIQRIQTIFLFLTVALMAATLFCPLFEIIENEESVFVFSSFGIGKVSGSEYPTWGVITFVVLSGLLAFINIFLYNKRKLQANLTLLTALFIVIFYVAVFVYLSAFMGKLVDGCVLSVQVGIILPFIALIFDLLAYTRIKKDEKLVKSLDRIR